MNGIIEMSDASCPVAVHLAKIKQASELGQVASSVGVSR